MIQDSRQVTFGHAIKWLGSFCTLPLTFDHLSADSRSSSHPRNSFSPPAGLLWPLFICGESMLICSSCFVFWSEYLFDIKKHIRLWLDMFLKPPMVADFITNCFCSTFFFHSFDTPHTLMAFYFLSYIPVHIHIGFCSMQRWLDGSWYPWERSA